MQPTLPATLALALCALASDALAQQGSFTLFGQPAQAITGDAKAVHPISAPYFHEDSFITSDLRFWFVYHKFSDETILDEGNAKAVALQVRLALTDRLQLVAYKDGYLWLDSDAVDEDGWNDVGAGLKYQFYRDYEQNLFMAAGVGYEAPWGDPSVFQNDGELRLWLSANKAWGKFHLGANMNYRITTSDDDEGAGNADVFSWHLHADYRLTDWFSPVIEVNGYHTTNEGDGGLTFSGADVINFPREEDPTISAAIGAEFRFNEKASLRGAFEFPITDADDLFGTRVTASFVYSF
jgi:hypothetical protein